MYTGIPAVQTTQVRLSYGDVAQKDKTMVNVENLPMMRHFSRNPGPA